MHYVNKSPHKDRVTDVCVVHCHKIGSDRQEVRGSRVTAH